MTLNARFILKCPYWTARLTYVLLRVSDSTICMIGVARGGGGGGLEGITPRLPCGQLTRCLSAVAELLVTVGLEIRSGLHRYTSGEVRCGSNTNTNHLQDSGMTCMI